MKQASIREARQNLKALLDQVAAGQEVVLLRRGKEVARLVPPRGNKMRLPSLEDFRKSIVVRGPGMSADIVKSRSEERY